MKTPEKSELAKKFGVADPPAITDADTATINSGPAIFANKMYATLSPQGMRLTFAEANPALPAPAFRTAVFLSYSDAAALMDLLQRQLSLIEVLDTPPGAETNGEKP